MRRPSATFCLHQIIEHGLAAYLRDLRRGGIVLVTDRGQVSAELRQTTHHALAMDIPAVQLSHALCGSERRARVAARTASREALHRVVKAAANHRRKRHNVRGCSSQR